MGLSQNLTSQCSATPPFYRRLSVNSSQVRAFLGMIQKLPLALHWARVPMFSLSGRKGTGQARQPNARPLVRV
jgi:hypothetical protein